MKKTKRRQVRKKILFLALTLFLFQGVFAAREVVLPDEHLKFQLPDGVVVLDAKGDPAVEGDGPKALKEDAVAALREFIAEDGQIRLLFLDPKHQSTNMHFQIKETPESKALVTFEKYSKEELQRILDGSLVEVEETLSQQLGEPVKSQVNAAEDVKGVLFQHNRWALESSGKTIMDYYLTMRDGKIYQWSANTPADEGLTEDEQNLLGEMVRSFAFTDEQAPKEEPAKEEPNPVEEEKETEVGEQAVKDGEKEEEPEKEATGSEEQKTEEKSGKGLSWAPILGIVAVVLVFVLKKKTKE